MACSYFQVWNPSEERRQVSHICDVPNLLGCILARSKGFDGVLLGEGGEEVDAHGGIIGGGPFRPNRPFLCFITYHVAGVWHSFSTYRTGHLLTRRLTYSRHLETVIVDRFNQP